MATRNLTMVVDRRHAEDNLLGFAADPEEFSDHSYVNMYLHHDGYPEWQGVQLANWLHANPGQDGSKLAAKLVRDHYYDSCYLYNSPMAIDHQYTYIIWSGKKDRWISCWDRYYERNIFVLKPEKVISKYINQKEPMDYTDFANGATRYDTSKSDNIKYHSGKLIDILTGFTD
mgnify:CR=1 FL=1|tara:strand:- start:245 stop:763 length:519 start_codon:yes stop_codon:yes gene_type:complete